MDDSNSKDVTKPTTPASASPRQRTCYSVQFKRTICRLKRDNADVSQGALLDLIRTETGVSLPQPSLSRILKNAEKWNDAPVLGAKRIRPGGHPALEKELRAWCERQLEIGEILTYARLQDQAKVIAREMNISEDDFKASNGWACRFCARHGLKVRRRPGDTGLIATGGLQLVTEVPIAVSPLEIPSSVPQSSVTALLHEQTGLGAPPVEAAAGSGAQGKSPVPPVCHVTGAEAVACLETAKAYFAAQTEEFGMDPCAVLRELIEVVNRTELIQSLRNANKQSKISGYLNGVS